MSFKQRLEQKQIQKLVLTQTLKQSIELLQYSQLELLEKIEEEARSNPFLKIKNKYYPGFFDTFTDYEATERKAKAIENTAERQKSLASHLLSQLPDLSLTPEETEAARILITSLDRNGFLTINPVEALSFLNMEPEKIQQLRRKIATLDPPGCCAVDFMESLVFQLEQKDIPEAKDAIYLLTNFAGELERKDLESIVRKTGFTEEKLRSLLALLRTLDPFPGRKYSSEETVYIEPDVYVFVETQSTNGKTEYRIHVTLNEKWRHYIDFRKEEYVSLARKKLEKTQKEELRKKYQHAQFLLYAMEHRNATLLKVAKVIVEFQREYFLTGKNLHPLRLKDVAEAASIHESTVSRITTNKYLHCRWGVKELKSFFRRGLKHFHSEKGISVDKVKELIKEIVEKEDKTIPLKDKEIADILIKKGIRIARRTVAKYRKELQIPSANDRMEKPRHLVTPS